MTEEHVIYNSLYYAMMDEDKLEHLMAECDYDGDKWAFIDDENRNEYEFFMDECNHVSGEFLVIADLGLWFGKRHAWRFCSNLRDAIMACVDGMDEWKVIEDNRGKVMLYGYHHDGTNVYEIRRCVGEINSNVSESTARKRSTNAHLRKAFGWI